MHVLVPKKIINEYKNGNCNGTFRAVGLFVDISGFSKMTSDLMQSGQHGAEILADMMRKTFAPLVSSVYAHHGFIATFAGDAFTALFPLDNGVKDIELHALSAAWEIQNINKDFTDPITGEYVSISTRGGLTCGMTEWGIITSETEHRAIFYFRGDAIEKCVESETLAKSDELIIDQEAYQLFKPHIEIELVSTHYRVTQVSDPVLEVELPQPDLDDLSTASLFYPKELIVQKSSGEFRQVVSMFISLPTVRTEEQLSIFMHYVFNLQDQYGGLINRINFGDKGSHLLIFWGAPMAYENDIERALNFILSLQTETSIPIKVGITYRIAHAGFIGSPLREEYTCYGQGVNLAARFMTAAPRGEVWIDEPIAKRVSHYFDVDYIDALSLKGFEEEQKVYSLYERKENLDPLFSEPFVGRTVEKVELQKFTASLLENKYAGALIIEGEAGIGKSRLLNNFLLNSEQVNKDDQQIALIALCHTDQILRESFNPFRYWLRRYFGVLETQVESRNKRSFNQTLDQLIDDIPDSHLSSELDRTRSFLGALVNLFWQDSLYEQLDPKGRYENTLIGLTSLITGISKKQPFILHLEDIQWLDEDSKAVLSQLHRSIIADQDNSYPIAIACTSRPGEHNNPLGDEIAPEYLKLAPLSGEEITQMAEAHLKLPVEQKLASLLTSISEGNPFYAEQVLYYLQEENLIEQDQDQWRIIASEGLPTPVDVRAFLVSRIDQFPRETKELVLTASVLGREFERQILYQMIGKSQDQNEEINTLENASIWSRISSGRYFFKSNLLMETAYKMQIHTQRQKLHAAAAEAIETLYSEDLRPYYFELAHHTQLGKIRDKACRYLIHAGDMAIETFQNNQAIDYFNRALRHTEQDDLETQISIYLRQEKVFNMLGKRDAQKEVLFQAETLAEKIGDISYSAKIAARQLALSYVLSDFDKLKEDAPIAVGLAEQAEQHEVVVSINTNWASALRKLGDYKGAYERLEINRILFQQTQNQLGEYGTLNTLGLIETDLGNLDKARIYLEECLQIAENEERLIQIAQTYNNLGNVVSDQGDYSSASAYYQKALKISQKIGARMGQGFLTLNLGWLAGIMGDYPVAKDLLLDARRISKEVGERAAEALSLVNLSLFLVAQGDYSQAKEYVEEGLTVAHEIQYRNGEAFGQTYLGHALSGLGVLAEAKTAYQGALKIRQEMGQNNLLCEPQAGLAQIALRVSDLETAGRSITIIFEHLDQGGTLDGIDHPNFVNLICYKVLAAQEDSRALPFLIDTHCNLHKQAEKIQDESLRQSFLHNVPWHKEIIDHYQKNTQK